MSLGACFGLEFAMLFVLLSFVAYAACQVAVAGLFQLRSQVSVASSPLMLSMPKVAMAALNNTLLIEEADRPPEVSLQEGHPSAGLPFAFGRKVPVDLNIHRDGRWEELDDGGRTWHLLVTSETAESLNLLFDEFELPEGAEFYIHSYRLQGDSMTKLRTQGAFTAAINNKDHRRFSTFPTPGNALLLEYFEPSPRAVSLHVAAVVHGFRPNLGLFQAQLQEKMVANATVVGFPDKAGSSGLCNINAPACSEATPWLDQVRSVVVFMTADGQKFCSGSMINNAAQDGRQYFLTANHCIDDPSTDFRYSILGFNYQSKICLNNLVDWPLTQTAQGLALRATLKASDFALFELQETIPPSYNVYMAGWTADNGGSAAQTPVAGIHHPSGDVKKISIADTTLTTDCWAECPRRYHWKIPRWKRGVTEPGSSGSPLFNRAGLIMGQLHGGASSCGNPSGYDIYGGIFASYQLGVTPQQRLYDWLNPRGDSRIVSVPGANLNTLRRPAKL